MIDAAAALSMDINYDHASSDERVVQSKGGKKSTTFKSLIDSLKEQPSPFNLRPLNLYYLND